MHFSDKTKRIICAVLAAAIMVPVAIGIVSMFLI